MSEFTESDKDFISFTSKIDRKGRALISAQERKMLAIGFGSRIIVEVNGSRFATKIDERGRFSVPFNMRENMSSVNGIVRCLR